MNCVTTSSILVLWNGEIGESFQPSRGIRQGDPLSPYLFVLCMERLSQLIDHSVSEGLWRPIHYSKNIKLTHLFYADDVFLFGYSPWLFGIFGESKGKEVLCEPKWKAPHSLAIKLNIDAAFINIGTAAGGGVFRNSEGHRIYGFFAKYKAKCAAAELCAIRDGLCYARDMALERLELETDAAELLKLIDGTSPTHNHELKAIMEDVNSLLRRNWNVTVTHVSRPANFVAHDLASFGMRMSETKQTFISMPEFARRSFYYDLKAIAL